VEDYTPEPTATATCARTTVYLGTYLARCRDDVLPTLALDPSNERENDRTPAQAIALLQVMIERAHAWRVLDQCERGRPLQLAGVQLERITGGLLSARVAVTCLDLLQRHGYVRHWVEGAGRGAIRMVEMNLDAIANVQRVAGSRASANPASRRETMPPRRQKEPTVPNPHTESRSTHARAREEPPSERARAVHTAQEPEPEPDPEPELNSTEQDAIAPAVAAFQAHPFVIDKLRPDRCRNVVRSNSARYVARAAATAAAAGASPEDLARAVRSTLTAHTPDGDTRGSRRVHSFGYPPLADCFADLTAKALRRQVADAARADAAPVAAEVAAQEPDADAEAATLAVLDMSTPELRAELDKAGIDPGSAVTKIALRPLVFDAMEARS